MPPPLGEALPEPGETFAGKYTIVRVVGEGGVGVVFEAEHQRLKQRVAIKVLRFEARCSDEWLARFDREARAAVKLRGPNVARVFDVDSLDDGTPYMVMELLTGRDLALEIEERQPIPPAEAVGYMLEACSAMAEAHSLGIIHRDLTPKNLFLAEEGGRRCLKVVDFGISKLADDRTNVTATDAAFGTPNYVSPEQIRSTSRVDARADIWSLGVILFEMLSGELPFEAPSAAAVIAAVVADPPRSLQKLRPELPRKLTDVVMKALEKDPAERYARVEDFALAIAPFGPPEASSQSSRAPLVDLPRPPSLRLSAEDRAPERGPAAISGSSVAGWVRPLRRGWLGESGRSTWIIAGLIGAAIGVIALGYELQRAPSPAPAGSVTATPPAAPPPSTAALLDPPAPLAPPEAPAPPPVAPASSEPRPVAVAPPPSKPSSQVTRRAPAPPPPVRPRPVAAPTPPDTRANPLHL